MTEKIIDGHIAISKKEVKKLLPHRWPFLLVREVVTLKDGKATMGRRFGLFWWVACKLGHFSKIPIVPGVVSVELCAQLAALIIKKCDLAPEGIPVFRSTKASFAKPLLPFNMAYAEVTYRTKKLGLFYFDCKVCNYAGETLSQIEIVGTSVDGEVFNQNAAKKHADLTEAAC